MEIVGYNLEHGLGNLPQEQADPVGSVRRMRALADRYQLALAFGPDRRFALDIGADAAPYVDLFILQVQRVQTDAQTVREFVEPLVTTLRRANPRLEVGVQFAVEGDATAIRSLVESLAASLDGVSLLTDHESTEKVEAVIRELRPSPEPLPDLATPVPAATSAQPAGAELPRSSAAERPSIAPSAPTPPPTTPTPGAQAVSPVAPAKPWVWLAVGLLTIVVVGVVITSAIHMSQRPAGR